jgi:hypothetical protein
MVHLGDPSSGFLDGPGGIALFAGFFATVFYRLARSANTVLGEQGARAKKEFSSAFQTPGDFKEGWLGDIFWRGNPKSGGQQTKDGFERGISSVEDEALPYRG